MTTQTTPKVESRTRRHEHEFRIDASPQAVWKAITEAEELVNWFPLEAEVQPGAEGHILYGWEDLKSVCRIQGWQPPSHLRTGWMEGSGTAGDEKRTPLAVDWYLENEQGRTRLRLVHSGFGPGQEWDEEYNGTKRGWDFELRSLKHYLEHHRGKRRTAYIVHKAVPFDAAQTWERMLGEQGLLQGLGSGSLRPGDPLRLTLGKERLEGKVFQYLPPIDLAFSADNLNRALLRVSFETCFGGPEALVFVSLWDYPQDQAGALKQRLQDAMDRVFD